MTIQIKEIIAEMRRLEKAASNWPWTYQPDHNNPCHEIIFSGGRDIAQIKPWMTTYTKDRDFILFARNNIPAILDYVAELEEQIKFLEETDLRHLD